MTNRNYYRAMRFEKRYGEGSILQLITSLNAGKTLRQISAMLSEIFPISAPQLMRYVRTFTGLYYYPAEVVKRYYYVNQKMNEEKETSMLLHELKALEDEDNVIYVNFRKTQKTVSGV